MTTHTRACVPWRSVRLALLSWCVLVPIAQAQERPDSAIAPDALVQSALTAHPSIRAAAARADAARAAISPAGTRPDPMLMAGVTNLPVTDPGFDDEMTMKMIGVSQVLPYPGKLALSRRAAELELAAAESRLASVRLAIAQAVRVAYYELAYLERALEVVRNNQALLTEFAKTTQSRYGLGLGGQEDVLKARVEATRLAEEAVMLNEDRTATLARLNALRAKPSDEPFEGAVIPDRIARAAVAADAVQIRFASPALGSRATGSPLPPLEQLQQRALANNPMLAEGAQMVAAQAAQVELAGRAYLPDFDLSLQYGQRSGAPDMVTALVSIPLPVQRARRQNQEVLRARAELVSREAELEAERLVVLREVAESYARIEQARAQLALFRGSIIPQSRATLQAAMTSFQVGRTDFLMLLETQATVFNYETAYHRLLADFAQRVAELERVVGTEVL